MAATHINFRLTRYLVNVLKALRDQTGTGQPLDGVKVIKMYPLGDLEIADLPLPAILVDLYEIEPDPDADLGTGQLGVQLMMQLWVVVAGTARGGPLTVRKLALNTGAILHDNRRFNSPVSPAKVTDIIGMPKLRDESSRQYLIWSVEWQHATVIATEELYCPAPIADAIDIDEVFWSTTPDVGLQRNDVGEPIPNTPNEKYDDNKVAYYDYERNAEGEIRRDANGEPIPARDKNGEPIPVIYDNGGDPIPWHTYQMLFEDQ